MNNDEQKEFSKYIIYILQSACNIQQKYKVGEMLKIKIFNNNKTFEIAVGNQQIKVLIV